MTEAWHCAQLPNGDNPLVVCQREQLTAENALLRSILCKLLDLIAWQEPVSKETT